MGNKKQIDGQDFCKCGHKEFHHSRTGNLNVCLMSGCPCELFTKADGEDKK